MSPGTKKILGLVGAVLLVYFVISDPRGSSQMVRSILDLLQEAAEALLTFLRGIFATMIVSNFDTIMTVFSYLG